MYYICTGYIYKNLIRLPFNFHCLLTYSCWLAKSLPVLFAMSWLSTGYINERLGNLVLLRCE